MRKTARHSPRLRDNKRPPTRGVEQEQWPAALLPPRLALGKAGNTSTTTTPYRTRSTERLQRGARPPPDPREGRRPSPAPSRGPLSLSCRSEGKRSIAEGKGARCGQPGMLSTGRRPVGNTRSAGCPRLQAGREGFPFQQRQGPKVLPSNTQTTNIKSLSTRKRRKPFIHAGFSRFRV
jgi:hypothetical protein